MTQQFVKINSGIYRNQEVSGTFELLKPHWVSPSTKKIFVQVNLTKEHTGKKVVDRKNAAAPFNVPSVTSVRVTVPTTSDIEYFVADAKSKLSKQEQAVVLAAGQPGQDNSKYTEATHEEILDDLPEESKAEALDRIRARFDRLDLMTGAVIEGHVRGLIVAGPPGIGKSYGVEQELDFEDKPAYTAGRKRKSEIVKGSITGIGLYKTLFEHSNKGDIVVFDDCDRIFGDEVCLNMLKAVLDSGDHRRVSWKAESHVLNKEDIPNSFEFKGGVIFITNVKLDNAKEGSKIAAHLEALVSRCHFLDLGIDDTRDIFLRIEQIVEDGMLVEYNLTKALEAEIAQFMRNNAHRLRELSLRTVLKIAQLVKLQDDWAELATETCCMPNGRGRRVKA